MRAPSKWVIAAGIGCALVLFAGRFARAQYGPPVGGWMYQYEGDSAAAGPSDSFDSLDGTWDHDNGSDEWDGTGPGTGRPGGFAVVDGSYLRIQDTGDPRDHGMADPGSNRKLLAAHDLSADGAAADLLDTGVSIHIRARLATAPPLDDLHPDGGGAIAPVPASGDGYLIHDGGKGNFGIKQASGGIVSFALATEAEAGAAGLVMNSLNGASVTADVDFGEGTANLLALDPLAWHDFWITIQAGGAGTHQVSVYMDGSETAAGVFDVTAGTGRDYDDISYVAIGAGSTGQSGAFDLDYVRVVAGAMAPPAALAKAFVFGSRDIDCETASAPGASYTTVFHAGDDIPSHDALAYSPAKGYGYEVLYPKYADDNTTPYGNRHGGEQFGPFDNSPNNRNAFDHACPAEIYNSMIGFKNFTNNCDPGVIGDADTPCSPTIAAEGGIFRVDVPNGFYRFLAVVGDAGARHTHRLLAEDGGSGPPDAIGANHVVLVSNHNQAQYANHAYARVGFLGLLPPAPQGPEFVNMDENGLPTGCPPNSPVLEVTQGYVRIHQLQGNASDGAGGAADRNGGDIVLLELWKVADGTTGPGGFFVDVTRDIEQLVYTPGSTINVHLTASGVQSPTDIVETIPAGWDIADPGGGTVSGDTLTLTLTADGSASYSLVNVGAECAPVEFVGKVIPEGGCPGEVAGETALGCVDFVCDPAPEDSPPELAAAFAFGSRNLSCPTYNDPTVNYTMVHHVNDAAGYDAITYSADQGYGFEKVYDAGSFGGRNGSDEFGPFDDSPNNRNRFADNCAEEIYDSFIGLKNFTNACNATTIGDGDTPCAPTLTQEGSIFRVDVPNGLYRFVAAVGEADNPHAHRLLAEDGGSGAPEAIGENHVVLVSNFDQSQSTGGEARGDCLGCGVFGRVGFNCRVPPLGDGVPPSPQFVNMDADGLATEGPPDSPVLEVTQGYVRVHMLQANANDGPGGKNLDPDTGIGSADPNGTDFVLLELWRVGDLPGPSQVAGDCNQDGIRDISDIICGIKFLFAGFLLLDRSVPPPPCLTDQGNLEVLDVNGDVALDVSDIVYLANFLFIGGPPPVQGVECFGTNQASQCPQNVACP